MPKVQITERQLNEMISRSIKNVLSENTNNEIVGLATSLALLYGNKKIKQGLERIARGDNKKSANGRDENDRNNEFGEPLIKNGTLQIYDRDVQQYPQGAENYKEVLKNHAVSKNDFDNDSPVVKQINNFGRQGIYIEDEKKKELTKWLKRRDNAFRNKI